MKLIPVITPATATISRKGQKLLISTSCSEMLAAEFVFVANGFFYVSFASPPFGSRPSLMVAFNLVPSIITN